jgi:hypothetical protein
MKVQCGDVQKVLFSVHKINTGSNVVVLDGEKSYMQNKVTGRETGIKYENGQYVRHSWVLAATEVKPATGKILSGNRSAILAAESEEQGFTPLEGRR